MNKFGIKLKNQKGFLRVIIILIISALIIATIGVFYYKIKTEQIASENNSENFDDLGKIAESLLISSKITSSSIEQGKTLPVLEAKILENVIVENFGGGNILIAECGDKNYISDTAEYIIEGIVEKVESKWNENKTQIFTYSNLLIKNYIKGGPFNEDKIQIVTEGGEIDGVGSFITDQPILHIGKEIKIYFKNNEGQFSVVCGFQGIEKIIKD